ncbi:uncharacterized protein LACBIDRAFT_327275 [Laccaria bicolor S238N-H82]|uniref:Predicted protein n=1 Tax=Laccaria bicolor (strain S238N-H82 / ATCC MYA-4686) TaxID=486041 RepID=B0DBQ4_LACBS|nr:uncharacterized protein LACBIDRAFT_327275 [Laccaria bicolor S238N-H82]EDR08040.1 predicted protein [Laccaria bicolor S238N-H82]|eukprot:XP_001881110.1 predicted protein [Laccaria bicolor S238N-H82]
MHCRYLGKLLSVSRHHLRERGRRTTQLPWTYFPLNPAYKNFVAFSLSKDATPVLEEEIMVLIGLSSARHEHGDEKSRLNELEIEGQDQGILHIIGLAVNLLFQRLHLSILPARSGTSPQKHNLISPATPLLDSLPLLLHHSQGTATSSEKPRQIHAPPKPPHIIQEAMYISSSPKPQPEVKDESHHWLSSLAQSLLPLADEEGDSSLRARGSEPRYDDSDDAEIVPVKKTQDHLRSPQTYED